VDDFTMRLVLAGDKRLDLHGPADITKETTEAIVNAANSSLLGGGGVDGAIHRAGGPSILEECKRIVAQIGRLPAGKAVLTTGGRLPCQYVVHTVGPVYSGGRRGEAGTLANCYRESIRIADDHGIRSLAFPAISTGAYGYPLDEAAQIAVPATLDALKKASHVAHVRFVMFDAHTLRIYVQVAEKLQDAGKITPLAIERASS
jgi:O-acetyl-ADP-ribose deacetylase (regulator of RNase III)